jgi:hypothetical protein
MIIRDKKQVLTPPVNQAVNRENKDQPSVLNSKEYGEITLNVIPGFDRG